MEPVDPSAWRGPYAPILPTIPIGDSPQEIYYMPTGVYPVQSTPLTTHENWVSQTILHPGSVPFCPSPLPVPVASGSALQPVIPNPLSLSTNPPDYVWVPQRQYALTAHHITPADPILFNVDSGEPGIRLSAAINRRFTHLRGRDDLVFETSKSPTITMRLEVCDLLRLAWTLTDGA